MKYRQLGRSGLSVSVVGLGCNNFGGSFGGKLDVDGTRAVVDTAIECGINLLDTANSYGDRGGSETLLGEVLKGRRDQVVLATKFGSDMGEGPDVPRASRWYIKRAVEDSLRRLQTDHIDLYQLHRPDGITPVEETLAALDDLVRDGKVLYIGSSNFAAWQVLDADWVARTTGTSRFISAQNHYSLLERKAEDELVPACEKVGVGILPFFPLANGLLTGKYRKDQERPTGTRMEGRDISDRTWDKVENLVAFAEERGHTVLELAFSGLLASPAVSSVIAGATRPEQVKSNAASADWELSEEDRDTLRRVR
ncbi:MAG TPA: aldo/keto reductase [Acidimicrobiales bacterium]|jgi:aryl-alcohol dehydrogenase-like predicted oxidoreductase|nr:aldo/keto reductase [Acidimicrobiales bacterium]